MCVSVRCVSRWPSFHCVSRWSGWDFEPPFIVFLGDWIKRRFVTPCASGTPGVAACGMSVAWKLGLKFKQSVQLTYFENLLLWYLNDFCCELHTSIIRYASVMQDTGIFCGCTLPALQRHNVMPFQWVGHPHGITSLQIRILFLARDSACTFYKHLKTVLYHRSWVESASE